MPGLGAHAQDRRAARAAAGRERPRIGLLKSIGLIVLATPSDFLDIVNLLET